MKIATAVSLFVSELVNGWLHRAQFSRFFAYGLTFTGSLQMPTRRDENSYPGERVDFVAPRHLHNFLPHPFSPLLTPPHTHLTSIDFSTQQRTLKPHSHPPPPAIYIFTMSDTEKNTGAAKANSSWTDKERVRSMTYLPPSHLVADRVLLVDLPHRSSREQRHQAGLQGTWRLPIRARLSLTHAERAPSQWSVRDRVRAHGRTAQDGIQDRAGGAESRAAVRGRGHSEGHAQEGAQGQEHRRGRGYAQDAEAQGQGGGGGSGRRIAQEEGQEGGGCGGQDGGPGGGHGCGALM
jgi:hypothetical protein